MPRRRVDLEKAKKEICQALAAGNTVRASCAYAGVSHMTFYRLQERDSDFREQLKKAEASSEVRLVTLIASAAQNGTWQAAAWLLERHPRTKADWKRLDELNLRSLTVEQLLAIESACAQRVESAGDRAALDAAASEPAE